MHEKSEFLSWVADPRMEVSNGSMLHVQLRKREFFQVATWTENTFVYSWGTYPTVIPTNVSTIRRHANEDVPVKPHTVALWANHERPWLIRVERIKAVEREIHEQIIQDICDRSDASSYDDVWIEESDSDW